MTNQIKNRIDELKKKIVEFGKFVEIDIMCGKAFIVLSDTYPEYYNLKNLNEKLSELKGFKSGVSLTLKDVESMVNKVFKDQSIENNRAVRENRKRTDISKEDIADGNSFWLDCSVGAETLKEIIIERLKQRLKEIET